MRTTISLDDDVYEAAAQLSKTSGKRLGVVVSELARRGLKPIWRFFRRLRPTAVDCFPRFLGHGQTTDSYLLALAESYDAEFATCPAAFELK